MPPFGDRHRGDGVFSPIQCHRKAQVLTTLSVVLRCREFTAKRGHLYHHAVSSGTGIINGLHVSAQIPALETPLFPSSKAPLVECPLLLIARSLSKLQPCVASFDISDILRRLKSGTRPAPLAVSFPPLCRYSPIAYNNLVHSMQGSSLV